MGPASTEFATRSLAKAAKYSRWTLFLVLALTITFVIVALIAKQPIDQKEIASSIAPILIILAGISVVSNFARVMILAKGQKTN
ncbi:hypothetical protein [Pseudomonas lactis]|uniref:Uncharacterized protein n=1 Tax=Pseudomonas lactis TaxID=1615674 RepID=A0A921T9T1_9PSED|nr:hypothetical protein [Pseudomonas lactis]HJH21299.1 hypothetical protein [Pseudomonas lactis]